MVVVSELKRYSDYDTDWHHNFGHLIPPTTCLMFYASLLPPNAACHTPLSLCLPVPGACNAASLGIVYAWAYMGTFSPVRLEVYCLLSVYIASYRQVDWKFVIECIFGITLEHARECTCDHLKTLHMSVQTGRLLVYHRAQLGTSLRACSWVYLGVSWEFKSNCTVGQTASMQLKVSGSVHWSWLEVCHGI